jgi:hypothetical protein
MSFGDALKRTHQHRLLERITFTDQNLISQVKHTDVITHRRQILTPFILLPCEHIHDGQ